MIKKYFRRFIKGFGPFPKKTNDPGSPTSDGEHRWGTYKTMGQPVQVDEDTKKLLEGLSTMYDRAIASIDQHEGYEEIEICKEFRKNTKDVYAKIKALIQQNEILHKELKTLEESSFREELSDWVTCRNCGKKTADVYPAYNHPEAPPVCFDCLPEKVKKELNRISEPAQVDELAKKIKRCFFIDCGDYEITCKEEELKQLLTQKRVKVDNDTILAIFDIYNEPETIPWKIAKVKKLLQSRRVVADK